MTANNKDKSKSKKDMDLLSQAEGAVVDLSPLRSSFGTLILEANRVVSQHHEMLRMSGLQRMLDQKKLFGNIEIPSSVIKAASIDLELAHKSWKAAAIGHKMPSIQRSAIFAASELVKAASIPSLAALDVARATIHASQTKKLLKGVNVKALDGLAGLTQSNFTALQTASASLAASYQHMTANMAKLDTLFSAPRFIIPVASREIFSANHAFKVLAIEELSKIDEEELEHVEKVKDEVADCEKILEQFAPDLLDTLTGAREALQSGNPDRVRHTLISLRGLVENLERRLAPNELVHPWIPENKKPRYLHRNKPTRIARFAYICRGFGGGSLEEFIDRDARAFSELFNVLARVHESNPCISETELKALMLRVESLILFILQIHQARLE